jgi:LacI family transcriptional regulator
LLEGRIDGAVVFLSGPVAVRARHLQSLRELTAPFVLLQEHDVPSADVPVISADDFGGARDLCRHLIAKGHRRIAFLTAVHRWSAIDARYSGYLAAHAETGLEPDEGNVVWHGNFDALSAADAAGLLLDRERPPNAIMCGNDLVALGVLKAARDRGLRVPEDVAVTGFDDFDFAAAIDPALTTVSIPGYEMGRLAARVLIDSVDGAQAPARHTFPTELRLRDSA